MGDLSLNLSRHEFACQCGCGYDTVDFELVTVVQEGCEYFDTTVTINSGARCVKHNTNIGGHPRSKHTIGKAADVVYKNVKPNLVAAYFERVYTNKYGIGTYKNFTHIDVQSKCKRWTG